MNRSIVTKRGDKGITDLFGASGIPKDSPLLHAYGDIDELNTILGILLTHELPAHLKPTIQQLQHTLFRIGADLATPMSVTHGSIKRVRPQDIAYIETQIITLESALPPQTSFILPRGCHSAGLLHHARAICRRAERWAVTASRHESLNPHLLVTLNRLSDYFFIAARTANKHMNIPEESVNYS